MGTWVEVNLRAIQGNTEAIKAHTGRRLIAVVKADAYGHGAVHVAKALHAIADMFAVATVEEGVELRQAGVCKPILILFSSLPDCAETLVANELTSAIDNWTLASRLNEVAAAGASQAQPAPTGRVKVHVDVNTGMNRSGVRYTEVVQFLNRLRTLHRLEIEGIFTHFATADEADKSYAYVQLERFSSVLASLPNFLPCALTKCAYNGKTVHAANSAAALAVPEAHFNAVRPGLSLYGSYPSMEKPIQLQPALTWKARVGWVDWVEPGEGVSYGLTYKAPHQTRVAGLQVGYGDGYPRALSGIGEVLIGGARRPIVGRICMDVTVIRLESSDNVSVGDEAILIGNQGDGQISVDEIAHWVETIPYEILTQIGKRVKRVYAP